jgi:hypothetical protein
VFVRVCLALLPVLAAPLAAQTTLADAARAVVSAWLGHSPDALVGSSPKVVLEIPGANPSAPVGGAQAAELLRRYLRPATERVVTVRTVREVAPGSGFVELDRTYAVLGTNDVRRETIYLRFRRIAGTWCLTELRTGP